MDFTAINSKITDSCLYDGYGDHAVKCFLAIEYSIEACIEPYPLILLI
jgi:hypothetical protein